MSSRAIGDRLNVSSQWVRDRLRDYNIPLRPNTVAKVPFERDQLHDLYVRRGIS